MREINFKIISKKNREVYQEGYVEIPKNDYYVVTKIHEVGEL